MKLKKMTKIQAWIWKSFFLFAAAGCLFLKCSLPARADEPVVIVIDPGHGGENLGAEYEEYTEKDLTMIVANAMKEELEKYEHVVVYLTRETDMDMSIEERAQFAKEKNADFLFCLHFNMSVSHDLFGAEVWVPASGNYYAKGYSFAQIEMQELTGLGLLSRGIKTRLNDKGDNYYGILRHCSNLGIPSALIEHCHLNHIKDQKFYQTGEEALREFGRRDALAAAKYFHLKSAITGEDFSTFPVPETQVPAETVKPDKTEPEVCNAEIIHIDPQTGEATIHMEASDSDNYILYYAYSLDGGSTYTMPDAWPRTEGWNKSDPSYEFTVQLPFDTPIEFRGAACNGFDVWTESEPLLLEPIPAPAQPVIEEPEFSQSYMPEEAEQQTEPETSAQPSVMKLENPVQEITEPIQQEAETNNPTERRTEITLLILLIIGIVLCMFFVSFFMSKLIFLYIKGNKRR